MDKKIIIATDGKAYEPNHYGFWVVNKDTGLVLSGWEYREDAHEARLEELDVADSSISLAVYARATVIRNQSRIDHNQTP